jgi:hypothetical protein
MRHRIPVAGAALLVAAATLASAPGPFVQQAAAQASLNFRMPVQSIASVAGVTSGGGKRLTSTVGVLSDEGGASSASFDARSGFLSAFDLAPPGFVVGLLENTAIPNRIHVSVLATERLLADPTFALTVDGSPRNLAFERIRTGLYAGELEVLGGTSSYRLTVTGRDLFFNQGSTLEAFSATPAAPEEGGALASADGSVALAWGEGAIPAERVLWMREPLAGGSPDDSRGDRDALLSFRVEPADMVLGRSARITLDAFAGSSASDVGGGAGGAANRGIGAAAFGGAGGGASSGFRLVREEGEETVPFYAGANAGEGTALITRLGGYRFERAAPGTGGGAVVSDRLLHAFPNPFHPVTTIFYEVEAKGEVALAVFDAGGRLVRTLFRGERDPGGYEAGWDGLDADGRKVASGVYFARLETVKGAASRKLVLEK